MRSPFFARAAFLLALVLSAPLFAAPIADPIKVKQGEISGLTAANDPSIHVYKGIPFAAPPVGELRWKPPVEPAKWEGVKACTEFSAASPQPKSAIPIPGLSASKTSEDCLYLNVWTPAKETGDKLPVMVWIHGGGFSMGSGGTDMYDGEAISRKGVVVVTVNYRLGPFGFLAHPLLSKESKHNSSGNYGLLDQIESLKWVQENIKAFGGNPDNVTIFGESAGGVSVSMLMVSPLSKGLFNKAIAQSGSVTLMPARHLSQSWYGADPMEKMGTDLAERLGCSGAPDELAVMRSKSVEEIFAASTSPAADTAATFSGKAFPYWTIVDGWVVPEDPYDTFEKGKQHDVPFMIGTNSEEGSMFVMMMQLKEVSQYEELLKGVFKDQTSVILERFPVTEAPKIKPTLGEVVTSGLFVAPARGMARGMGKVKSKAYLYHFTKHHQKGFGASLGAHHAAEIPYVFGNLERLKVGDQGDAALSAQMMDYWVNFASKGDPNGGDLPKWPAYNAEKDEHIVLGDKVEAASGLRKADSDLFDGIKKNWRATRDASRDVAQTAKKGAEGGQ